MNTIHEMTQTTLNVFSEKSVYFVDRKSRPQPWIPKLEAKPCL